MKKYSNAGKIRAQKLKEMEEARKDNRPSAAKRITERLKKSKISGGLYGSDSKKSKKDVEEANAAAKRWRDSKKKKKKKGILDKIFGSN